MTCGTCKACATLPDEFQPYGVEIHTTDGVFIKEMHIPRKGTVVPQHSHAYDHTTMLAKGSVRVWVGNSQPVEYLAPKGIFIPAKVFHTFESLEDDTICYCIHRERDGGAEVAALNEVEFV